MSELQWDCFVPGESLVKYGESKHMVALYERGEVYLRVASDFQADSHNEARRDDELCLTFVGPAQLEYGGDVIAQRVEAAITQKSSHDYCLYCLSKRLDKELFRAFDADACVILHGGKDFCNTCLRELARTDKDIVAWGNDVSYVDTDDISAGNIWRKRDPALSKKMNMTEEQLDRSLINSDAIHNIFLRKSACFEGQGEYRMLAWYPNHRESLPRTRKVYLGSLIGRATLLHFDKITSSLCQKL